MRPEATTILLLYTDAPPHEALNTYSRNGKRERKALSKPSSYGGLGPKFVDWVSACKELGTREKKAQVFSILRCYTGAAYYRFLCTITGGACFELDFSDSTSISKVTVEVLLAWMGVQKAGDDARHNAELPAYLSRYRNAEKIDLIEHEYDPHATPFFSIGSHAHLGANNITRIRVTPEVLKTYLPKKKTPVSDFAKSWANDAAYRAIAVENLRSIIDDNVVSISLNPVFGSFWRAVCSDRTNYARGSLVTAFSLAVDRITDPVEKAQMRAWLEESYNFSADIQDIINSVPEEERFPCVCLDPTLNFIQPETNTDGKDEDEAKKPITAFTRAELQEIGRSCDFKILRRLGRILTQLTYVERAADMPAHIAAADDDKVPKIPVALASKKHKGQFWRILLHVILPGTILSSRAAALLAALSLRLGVAPLREVAEEEMLRFRDKWNNIEVPENWNVSCLPLLLSADQAYRQRQQDLEAMDIDNGTNHQKPHGLLNDSDRSLFESLVAFRMLELNLDSTLMAQIGWKPDKTVVPMGPVIVCRSCQYPRSVTIMGQGGICGLCTFMPYKSPEQRKQRIDGHVSTADGELTPLSWVECGIRACRAQYVVYNVEHLNVRPKCYYCRSQNHESAPYVECTRCLSRIIWPEEYRPPSLSGSDFNCPACASGRKTIIDVETTAKKISADNTTSWLIHDSECPDEDPFTHRSLYKVISAIGTDRFVSRIRLFPPVEKPLTQDGKVVRNPDSLISTLQDLIARRQTERVYCSLCFSAFNHFNLHAACGRRGCSQRICRGCLSGWYGLNAAGRIINAAALSCPFCRREPDAKILARYEMGIHAVGNLANAVQEKGQWIHAWCKDCGFAKQYMERVCARGMPANLQNWSCDECRKEAEEKTGSELLKTTRRCPGCNILTEKISGCDHVQCTACGAHWCYFFGGKFPEKGIYPHMSLAHGGFYGGGDGDWEENEWDSDDGDD